MRILNTIKNILTLYNKSIRYKHWNHKFSKIHPSLNINESHSKKLRLILGIGRSGTTWTGKVLSTTTTPIRFFEEPLYYIKPRFPSLWFNKHDHTAVNYIKTISANHYLYRTYKYLTTPKYSWKLLGVNESLKRNDIQSKFCLIKEVHSLLATETLLKKIDTKTIIITRDPIYIADSLFNAQKISTKYLVDETKMIKKNKPFLGYVLGKENLKKILKTFKIIKIIKNKREKIIFEKILTITILTKYLQKISHDSKKTYLISYEKLCQNPEKYFSEMSSYLSLGWNEKKFNEIKKASYTKKESNNPYSIHRNTKKQINHPLKILKQNEVRKINDLLKYCELDYRQ